MKKCFYDICQMNPYHQRQWKLDGWVANAENWGIKKFEDCARTYSIKRGTLLTKSQNR